MINYKLNLNKNSFFQLFKNLNNKIISNKRYLND